jgi:hypothetical protein
MSKELIDQDEDMREEYDFKHAIRNPYARLARNGPLVRLEPDVLEVFPDSEAVNEALRLLIKAAKHVKTFPKAS